MTEIVNHPASLPPRPPRLGPWAWARANLFSSWYNTALTLAFAYVAWLVIPGLVKWGLVNASLSGDAAACRAAGGACWSFIAEKWRFILFGTFPDDQQWRPTLAMLATIATLVISADRRTWGRPLLFIWGGGLGFAALMMFGGVLGMDFVPTGLWGGLPLTLALSVVGLGASFPLGVLLALGRTSDLPVMRGLSVVYIELVRGVPLISILFMASVMLPLFLPQDVPIDKLLRALIGITLFSAAYVAEVVRGGLQAIPRGQVEASKALGLGYWQRQRLIILPQALALVIPPLVNSFIAIFKDTSLVIIIGLLDLLSTAKSALTDPAWRGFYKEAYLFVGVIYFLFCYALSRYSRHLETVLGRGRKR